MRGKSSSAFWSAHLQIEVALERVVDVDKGPEMGPSQLSTHCGDNLCVGEGFRKSKHVAQILGRETATVFELQLSRQCRDNLLTIGGAFLFEHFGADALADVPVKRGQCTVDDTGELPAALFEQAADFAKQLAGRGSNSRFLLRGLWLARHSSTASAVK